MTQRTTPHVTNYPPAQIHEDLQTVLRKRLPRSVVIPGGTQCSVSRSLHVPIALLLHPKDTDVVGMKPLSDVVVEQIQNMQLRRGKSEPLDFQAGIKPSGL